MSVDKPWNPPVIQLTRKHWYFVSISECPECGRVTRSKERRYTPRPRYGGDRQEHSWDTSCAERDISCL